MTKEEKRKAYLKGWYQKNRKYVSAYNKLRYISVKKEMGSCKCLVCGKEFKKNHIAQKFCSADCRSYNFNYSRPRKGLYIHKCFCCGKTFSSRRPSADYCGNVCRNKIWLKDNPNKAKQQNDRVKLLQRKHSNLVTNRYIISLFRAHGNKSVSPTPEMIEQKRQFIKLKRLIHEKSKQLSNAL